MVAKERFFPLARKFHAMCHSPTKSYKGTFLRSFSLVYPKYKWCVQGIARTAGPFLRSEHLIADFGKHG